MSVNILNQYISSFTETIKYFWNYITQYRNGTFANAYAAFPLMVCIGYFLLKLVNKILVGKGGKL